ncbi:conserved hypothetical protein [Perkinsus marinus ATCC 50983]|uniref:Uncharacterized protein n=1 Tax=Perkinsus marinus (strain ATCC 50983 / TXsc) TaxID=423536 RepID=C5L6D9_PERM5|nr:conserved hypothetical protein [Perkinsus marinus ATCC 50983]EER07766.1 conserved hypothetical protein [Perkinsus marinus ATCC 50983]|eukprot:XP_002775950.1 conserved hypothetical protein [Perkinsus marinus ATCC 50983]
MVTDVRMPICRCYQAFIAQLEQGVDQTHPVADLDAMQREVLALLDAALDQTRRRYGEKDLRCARLQELIAKVYVNRMQNSYAAGGEHEYLDLAKEHYEQARAIRVHRLGASSRAVLEISVGVAQAEMLAGREKEAVKMMIQTLQSIEDAETEVDVSPLEMLVKAHELATSTYKPTDRRVIDVMRDLALRAVKSEEHEKARRYLSEILEVEEQIHGQYSVPVCRTLNALASVLIALEELEDAKAVLSK